MIVSMRALISRYSSLSRNSSSRSGLFSGLTAIPSTFHFILQRIVGRTSSLDFDSAVRTGAVAEGEGALSREEDETAVCMGMTGTVCFSKLAEEPFML